MAGVEPAKFQLRCTRLEDGTGTSPEESWYGDGLSPEEVCRREAQRIASFYYPRNRVSRLALENDVFIALQRSVEAAFRAGLERAPESSAAVRLSHGHGHGHGHEPSAGSRV